MRYSYNYGNVFRASTHRYYPNWTYKKIKSQRDDFNDMFFAETLFRERVGDRSLVFCLTYNDEHLRSFYGQNVVDSDDLKLYAKSSRLAKQLFRDYNVIMDLVSVPEYGNGGKGHSKKSSRGKGQNPHFHCVAWFHNVEGYKIKDEVFRKIQDLVRTEWQGCNEPDIEVYGRSKDLRKKGLGYVSLDGEIKSPEAGGSYISKYIGKDIGNDFKNNLSKNYFSSFVQIVKSVLDELCHYDVPMEHLPAVIGSWLSRCYDLSHDYVYEPSLCGTKISKFAHDFYRLYPNPDKPLASYTNIQDTIFEELNNHFRLFDDEFRKQWDSHHAVKLRKFHGFGHDLVNNTELYMFDVLRGKYSINRNGRMISRHLPPSLFRHVYYTARVVELEYPTLSGRTKSVVYDLNDKGKFYVKNAVVDILEHDLVMIRNFFRDRSSQKLKDNAVLVSFFSRFVFPFDCLGEFFLDYVQKNDLLKDPIVCNGQCYSITDKAMEYISLLHRKEFDQECTVLPDRRSFISGLYISSLFVDMELIQEFQDLLFDYGYINEVKQREYLNNWYRCYMADY